MPDIPTCQELSKFTASELGPSVGPESHGGALVTEVAAELADGGGSGCVLAAPEDDRPTRHTVSYDEERFPRHSKVVG